MMLTAYAEQSLSLDLSIFFGGDFGWTRCALQNEAAHGIKLISFYDQMCKDNYKSRYLQLLNIIVFEH